MTVEIGSARAIARRVLQARFKGTATAALDDPDLAAFQRDAVARLDMAISRFGGAILADSVGLGKTYVGAALARRALARGLQLLVVTPPALRRQWWRALPDERVRMLSHATLGRSAVAHPWSTRAPVPMLIVVDEAHAFRNPATRRYRALAALTRGARVLLITATPINNSLDDLYWLLRLFAGDATFGRVGIPDLRACFEHAKRSGGAGRIPSVLAQVMVRRTRSLLLDLHGTLELPGGALRFPRREPPVPVPYATPGSWRTLLRSVEELELRRWSERAGRGADLLLRLMLLRRAESSRAAAIASFQTVDCALESMIAAIDQGLDPRSARRRPARPAPDGQLTLAAVLLAPLASHAESAELAASLRRDRTRIAAVLAALRAEPDAKLSTLRELLRSLDGRAVVLFTEFRETAVQLHRALRTDFRTGLVHGGEARLGDARAGRRTVTERFAPFANGAPAPPARERVQLLITTDVLSEGLNLHDAADVISYDLPWNPVRLIQRIGRIDRLGSQHSSIRSYHFVPARDLERSLGLVRRLRRKLHAIGSTIGLDEAVLADSARDLIGVLRGDATALERIEQHDALIGDVAERLRAAWLRLGHDESAGLPLFRDALPLAIERVRHADPAGTPVGGVTAAVPLPAALGRARGPIACVFVETDGVQRAWLVRGRVAVEDERVTGAVLLAALSAPDRSSLTASQLGAARRAIRRAAAQITAPVPAPPQRWVLPALRKRLLVQLERTAGGPTVAECTRAEAALRALENCTAGTELLLRERLPELRRLPLDALCAALLAASSPDASGKRPGAGPPAQNADRPGVVPGIRILGVLLVKSSGALPAVDSSRPAR